MATYSRSQSTNTQTSQSSVMPSMDISSLLVKTMQNVMNDNNQDGNKDFEKTITDGINNSDLLKDKTKNDPNKELSDLLKDKKNTDKELSNLLKDTNKNSKDAKKEKSVKDSSDKIAGTLGKIVSGGIIAGTIGGILKGGKGLGGVLGGAVSGAGKGAGGLLSGVGNVGGSLIAGVGKLFGPVGGMIGKAVGTAVAAPFKILGGTIKAVGDGLGKLMSMPLKELVTKGTLIVGVLSQLFVFLEGLMAKFIAERDIKWIDFMSKLKSNISIIPDKLKLSLEQILSKVRIAGQPIFGSLSKDEEAELDAFEGRIAESALSGNENDPLVRYLMAQDKIDEAEKQNQKILDSLQNSYTSSGGMDTIDFSQYNLNTTKGKEALMEKMLSTIPEDQKEAQREMLNNWLSDYSYNAGTIDNAQKERSFLERTDKDVARYKELSDLKNTPRTAEYYAEQNAKLEEKQKQLQQDYFTQGLYDLSNKQVKDKNGNIVTRGLTAYEQQYADSLHAGSMAKVQTMHSDAGTSLTTKDATGAERFLQNQYKQWTDAWGKMFKDLKQDIGINITQKQDFPNPEYNGQ